MTRARKGDVSWWNIAIRDWRQWLGERSSVGSVLVIVAFNCHDCQILENMSVITIYQCSEIGAKPDG